MKLHLVTVEYVQRFKILVQAPTPDHAETIVERLEGDSFLAEQSEFLEIEGHVLVSETEELDGLVGNDDEFVLLSVHRSGSFERTTLGELRAAEAKGEV